jgi:hypothetical protein
MTTIAEVSAQIACVEYVLDHHAHLALATGHTPKFEVDRNGWMMSVMIRRRGRRISPKRIFGDIAATPGEAVDRLIESLDY